MELTIDNVAILLGAAVIFVLLLALGKVCSARRIARWCKAEGYELVDWRGAKFFEGPHRSDNQDVYFIEVRDHHGIMRAGYLIFGNYWLPLPWPFKQKVRVEWT